MLHILLEFIGEEQSIYSPDITFYRSVYFTCWICWLLLSETDDDMFKFLMHLST